MSYYARVVNGVVVEPAILLLDVHTPADYYSASLPGTWQPSPNASPTTGWTFDGVNYTPPPVGFRI
jgi:hypothetical protein